MRIGKLHLIWIVSIVTAVFAAQSTGASGLEDFHSKRSASGPYIILYHPRIEKMADEIEILLVESAEGIAGELGLETIDTIRVFLVPDEDDYRQLHRLVLPEWGVAFSEIRQQILGVNTAAVLQSPRPLRIVIRHELSHLLLAQRVGAVRVPLWFMEGLAILQASEWGFKERWKLAAAVWSGRAPDLEDLVRSFPTRVDDAGLAYSVSFFAVDELLRGRPEDLITLTAFIRDLGDFDEAFQKTFGESTESFAARVHALLSKKYRTTGGLIRTTPYWLILALLFVTAYFIKRFRNARKLKKWERSEASAQDGLF